MAGKLSVDTITNAMIMKKLGLSNTGERHFDIFRIEVLEHYFGEYSLSAKAYRTWDVPNPFFLEIAKFLIEVGCVHLNAYGMPKQKAGFIISTFEGCDVDWVFITRTTVREGLHAFQIGKKLRLIEYNTQRALSTDPTTTKMPLGGANNINVGRLQ